VVVKVSLCMLAVACVKVPAFEQRDGGAGDGQGDANGDGGMVTPFVHVELAGANARATMRDYELVFSSDGAKFPHLLNLNPGPNQQFIMGGSEQCADEQGMGIALYPAMRINGTTGISPTPAITIPLEGPYVGQLRLEWTGSFTCATPANGALTGHTTFSFFPNGRFARYDVINNPSARDVANCSACGPTSSSFYLSSYTTLIVDNNATLSDGTHAQLDGYGEEISPSSSTCINQRGYSIAFSWIDTLTRMRAVATAPARTISFIKDFPAGPSLPMMEWRATTQMGISKETCAVLEPRITPFSEDDHQLVINGNPTGAAQVDGIYGGDPQVNGYPIDFPVTLTASTATGQNIPAGFAVWLYHAPVPQTLTVTHSRNPTGEWYYEQRAGTNSVVYWFNVSLEQGETITISGS
jgi:hypothetical protein